MNIKTFNYSLIVLTVIGLFLLYLSTFLNTPLSLDLTKDNTENLEKVVSVSGTIKNFNLKKNNLFFEVCNYSKCLTAVYFNISKSNLELIENIHLSNKQIKVTGKYTLYNDKKEIIVYKFEKL